ncbi:hypothetical protein TcWFU_002095 [Taenia crassiceps]|uniref:Uncharacterized protein n=1 Tax=Taenia crassiceps TaxID=6207 RepID=A0ABR4Q5K2_9CEST
MGEIIGKCAKKKNEASSLEEWTKWHKTGVYPLDDDTKGVNLSAREKGSMPKKAEPKAKAKSKMKDEEYDSDFCEESLFSNPPSSSISSEVMPYAVKPRYVHQHLPPPGLRILTKKPEKADWRWYTETVSLDAGVHCWLWVDDTKTVDLCKSGDRRLIAIARRCDCLIELSPDQRYHLHRGLQRRIDIYARDDRCLTKCLNLLEETFWNFRLRNFTFSC